MPDPSGDCPIVDGLGTGPHRLIQIRGQSPCRRLAPARNVLSEPGASEVRPDQPPEVTPDATLGATLDLPPDSMTATSRAREATRDRTRDCAPGHPLELTRGFLRVPGFLLPSNPA